MAEMSLRDQIRAIEEMVQGLKKTCEYMDMMLDQMSEGIKGLRGEGFTMEKEEDYRERFFNPASAVVKEVTENIRRYHVRYLEDVKDDLRSIWGA